MFNFEVKKIAVYRAEKFTANPLVAYARIIATVVFYLFIVTSVGFLLNVLTPFYAVVCLLVFLIFLEIAFFSALSIKNIELLVSLADAVDNPENYNLAEFLDIPACRAANEAISGAQKRKLPDVSSAALFYALVVKDKDIQQVMARLGADVKKVSADLNNALENTPRVKKFNLNFASSFQETIAHALGVAAERGSERIGVKELLVALATTDEFFKQLLITHDLKEEDVKNITLWLSTVEKRVNQQHQFWTKENLARYGSLGKDFAAGFTVTLDQFSIDWRKRLQKNPYSQIIGHRRELKELETILAKSENRNALVVGEVGTGRKSIVQLLAQQCNMGLSLPELNNKRVVELDMVKMAAQVEGPEKLEATLDQALREASAAGNIILFIDELDNFVGQKTARAGAVDISAVLPKYLAMPEFQFVGVTSYAGLHQRLEQNPALLNYFAKVEVAEMTELETIQILQNLAMALEKRYKMLVVYPTIREIINLTARYLPNLPFPQKAIDVLQEAATHARALKDKVLLPHHIAQIISQKTQIPVGKMDFKEKSALLNLEKLIHSRIVNQEEAVAEISIAMRRARAGLSSKKRPMGNFLFLGPTGVGKTETAKALASIYFGGEEKMIRLDMSEFQAVGDIPRLLGSAGANEQQGLLTTPVRESPFALVLLDEVEKAHRDILNVFLQVFDEGHVTDGQGRKVMFTNTIIIATSNAGAPEIFKTVAEGKPVEKDALVAALVEKGIFKPEFINRFDAVVVFHPLTKQNLMDIAQLLLTALAKNLKEKDIEFMVTEALKEKIVELSYKPEFGARQMRRVIQDKMENVIAQALLSETLVKGNKFEINPETFELVKLL